MWMNEAVFPRFAYDEAETKKTEFQEFLNQWSAEFKTEVKRNGDETSSISSIEHGNSKCFTIVVSKFNKLFNMTQGYVDRNAASNTLKIVKKPM